MYLSMFVCCISSKDTIHFRFLSLCKIKKSKVIKILNMLSLIFFLNHPNTLKIKYQITII